MADTKSEFRAVVADATYDALNIALPIGTLVKASIRLYKLSQQRRIEEFARAVISGSRKRGKREEEISGAEGELFAAILRALATDREDQKAALYADTYLYISRNSLFATNRSMAEYIIEAVSQLRVADMQMIFEIQAFLDRHLPDEPTRTFFQHLELAKGDGKSFSWDRRLSVQTLVRLGLLARIQPDMPLWTTEQYDIISRLVRGIDDEGKPFRTDN